MRERTFAKVLSLKVPHPKPLKNNGLCFRDRSFAVPLFLVCAKHVSPGLADLSAEAVILMR